MSPDTITRDMPIGTVVKEHPETVPVFLKHGLHCIGCHVAAFESVAEGAQDSAELETQKAIACIDALLDGTEAGLDTAPVSGATRKALGRASIRPQ